MSRATKIEITDDYSGEIVDGEVHSVDLTLDGLLYSLDLSKQSREKLSTTLEPFIKNVSPVRLGGAGGGTTTTKRRGGGETPTIDREQNRAMRAWWHEAHAKGMKLPNGAEVPAPSDRGRIPTSIVDAYHTSGGVTVTPDASEPEATTTSTEAATTEATSPETLEFTEPSPRVALTYRKTKNAGAQTAADKELVKTVRQWAKKNGAKLPATNTPQWAFDAYEAQDAELLQTA